MRKDNKYYLLNNGAILIEKKTNLFKEIWGIITNKPYYSFECFAPRRPYNNPELSKLSKLVWVGRDLEEDDIIVILNHIRPNTIKESLSEIRTSKYYINATAKEDINLLRTSK